MSTVKNPVIPGFHPDPSVCRVGEDYYLACSSFEYFPGVPIFHSRDLVNWAQLGNVLDRPEQLRLPPGTRSSGGIYAPTLRHHDGRFWLITTNVEEGNLLFTASDPAGPWSDPVRLPGVHGIDPDLAWDEDGTCWCTTAGVWQVRIDPYTGEAFGEPQRTWSGTPGAHAPEAPHLYRIGDYWYLLIAEGGTARGHAVSVARGRTPSGPFEPCPANPRHHYAVEVAEGKARALARIGPLCTVLATAPVPAGPLVLRVGTTEEPRQDARSAPDTVSLGVEEPDGTFTVLAALDGRYLSTEVAGGFTGRVIGAYAAAGTVRFDWYDYEHREDSG